MQIFPIINTNVASSEVQFLSEGFAEGLNTFQNKGLRESESFRIYGNNLAICFLSWNARIYTFG